MKKIGLLFVVTVLACTAVAFAEAPPEMPQPTAEHKALEMWVGTWHGTGDMKAGEFGPGGHMEWSEDCSWFAGAGFNVVCKSKGTAPTGPMQGLGVVGYNPEKKVYTHYGVDNSGWSGYAEGTRSGDSWTFQSTELMGGKEFHSRFTMTMTSPKEMEFSWGVSEDGENWTTMMEGTSKKD